MSQAARALAPDQEAERQAPRTPPRSGAGVPCPLNHMDVPSAGVFGFLHAPSRRRDVGRGTSAYAAD